ncbi:putative coatomer complex subunit delta [Encephalitozoon romaleae SJ-2008]|uniref:Coatomer subunit delta n=1 Tax=Encephalitozoon romaleae (strain SJ-2008) TaxID=1178016 RepID=I6ZJM6_ENCRO|nr:putative coatomer complex subunit delta [Encephalitozoon romaleae SJ-2008]AFN83448.1 putative coatomer complex subunit delta [Encephalitozoon romaleae SJ-2008]
MIIGLFVANSLTGQTVSRMTRAMAVSKIEHFILDFISSGVSASGVLPKGFYKYVYSMADSTYYVVIASMGYNNVKAQGILDLLQKNTDGDMVDALVTMDNILYGQTTFDPNIALIKSMDSQEEKIHELMMKNKNKELIQKQKELQRRPIGDIDRELERVRNLEIEMRNENIQQLKSIVRTGGNPAKEKRRELETSMSSVFILFKERLKMVIDKENNIKSGEVQGDMSITIREEEYKDIEIKLGNVDKDMKFSPNLDKSVSNEGILRCEKGFPIEKNVALVKWKGSDIREPPITFTFWPSETSLNVYQIMFEYTAECNMKDLNVFFSKANISNIKINGTAKERDSHIEWSIGDVEKGTSDTLEFSCTCTDPSEIFPLEIYFTSDFVLTRLFVEKVTRCGEEVDELEIKKVFEVDKFTVVDE